MQMTSGEPASAPMPRRSPFGRFLRELLASRARRRALIALAVALGVAGLGVGGAVGWLMVRLSSGPIEFATLKTTIEDAVSAQLGEVAVAVGGAQLVNDDGDIVVRLQDVVIRDQDGAQLVRAPHAVVGTRLLSAAFGSLTPTTIELVGPHLNVHRRVNGAVSLGFGDELPQASEIVPDKGDAGDFRAPELSGETEPGAEPPDQPLGTELAAALSGLKQLLIRDARLTVHDDASRSVWDSYNATLTIRRPGSGLAVVVDAPFTTASGEWRVNLTMEQERSDTPLIARADFENVVPTEIAARMETLSDLAGFDLPISGSLSTTISPSGEIDAVAANINLSAGFIRRVPFFGEDISPMLIDEGQIVATYSRAETRLDIERFAILLGSNLVDVSGTIAPEFDADGAISGARFDLRSHDLQVAADDIARPAAEIRRALASGHVGLHPLQVELDALALETSQGRINVGGTAAFGDNRGLSIQGLVEKIDVTELVQLWPRGVASGARGWIAARMPAGRVTSGQIDVELTADDMARMDAGEPLREEALAISFSFDGAAANYLEGLPLIRSGRGRAELSGDRFTLSLDDAETSAPSGERIAINFGRFSVPTLAEGELGALPGDIQVSTLGPLRAALEVLDLDPLEFTREFAIDPAGVEGNAQILIDLTLPLSSDVTFDEIQVRAGATLTGVRVPDAFQAVALEASQLEIIATHQRIEAQGDVRLNGVPARAKWDARFAEAGGRASRLTMRANVSGEDLKRIGIDMSDLVDGEAPMEIEALGRGSKLEVINIDANVTDTSVELPAIGWAKEPGEPASLSLQVERLANDQVRLRNIQLRGNGIDVDGAIRLDPDGSLYKLDLDRFKLGEATDVAMNGVRGEDGVLRLKVKGPLFNAAKVLERAIADQVPLERDGESRPTDIEYDIATVKGRENTDLSNVTGKVRIRNGAIAGFTVSGAFESKQKLQLDYGLGSGESPAIVSIDTGDAGAFVRFLGLYKRAYGGVMNVRARGPDGKNLRGSVNARNFRVINEPLLMRIANAQAGLTPAVARDVSFTRLTLDFTRTSGLLTINDALIAGPAVGASMRGRVDVASEAMGLSGTYIPAYGFNAAFGAIPLVGPILSGRSGEGLVGMTFSVEGQMANPTIRISPMSTIAPGFLRRFFEFQQR